MNRKNNAFFGILAISLFIHLILFFIYALTKSEGGVQQSTKNQQVSVTLKHKEKPKPKPIPRSKKQPEPKKKPEKEKPSKPKEEEAPDLPDSYKAGEESQSLADVSEKTDEGKAAMVTGERAEVLKQKSLKAKKTQKEAGAIGTTGRKDGIEVTDSDDVVTDEELEGGLYDLGDGIDDESNDSFGDVENGIVSDKTVEFSEQLNDIEFNEVGNTVLLSDTQLSDSFVKDPLSEKRSNEIKIINGYLKEVMTLVGERWSNPLTPSQQSAKTGVVVRFSVSMDGYIIDPYVFLQSEFPILDESILEVLQSLSNHKLGWHKSYIEKYRHFNLRWSGSGQKYEIMPYEAK